MPDKHYVIIGNGAAANSAADVIRDADSKGRISLISDECFPFYYRHLLSNFIVGQNEEDDLMVRPPAYYREKQIRLRLGQTVVKVDFEDQRVYLKHMETVRYSSLLLCVGGKPRIPEVHYSYRHHFYVLKTLADARDLRQRLPEIRQILIVGGDLISVLMSRMLLKEGKEVIFMIDKEAFWPLELSDEQLNEFKAMMARRGARIVADDMVKNIEPDQKGSYKVQTREGKEMHVDLVGAFFGFEPDVEFLRGSGLNIERGILVNEYLQTNFPNVYSAGDCAQVYNPEIKNYWVSFGWPNAERLGAVAAHNILGETMATGQPPESALTLDGVKVNTAWWREF